MDEPSIQSQMAESQKLIFDILGVVYESEYPITLEAIAYQTQQSSTNKLAMLVSNLVSTGHLQIHMRDGNVNYHKPTFIRSPLLPLPYHRILD